MRRLTVLQHELPVADTKRLKPRRGSRKERNVKPSESLFPARS